MSHTQKWLHAVLPLTTSALLMLLSGCAESEPEVSKPTPEAVVSQPIRQVITEWDEYTGRFRATDRVEVRARVGGYLESINFQDGAIVDKDDVLFVIDQRPFKIALQRAQAEFNLAQKDFERGESLRADRAISTEEFDSRAGQLEVARAALNEAKLNLEFTEVRAPISGRVSRDFISLGNLISGGDANATLLTTVVSIDPIHFYFEASERDYLKYVRLDMSGAREGSRNTPNPIYVRLQDEDDFDHTGQMDFVDNELSESTGTIQGRAIFENSEGLLQPGLFGRARLIGSGEYEAVLLPDELIGTDQSQKFVLIVNDNNQVERRFVEIGPLHYQNRIIRQGLTGDERVIIRSIQRFRQDDKVNPVMEPLSVDEVASSAKPAPADRPSSQSISQPTNESADATMKPSASNKTQAVPRLAADGQTQ